MALDSPPVPGAGPSLAEILRAGLSSSRPSLPQHHWRILNALLACRTPPLGGHRYRCEDCGRTHFVPHSCRNRHCPLCQGQKAREWLAQEEKALLPIPYFHLVFTLPHGLNLLIQQNQRAAYLLLFRAVSQTLLQFGRQGGMTLGITAVLHTWSQTLLDHYHLHCIVSGGGLSLDGSRWVRKPAHYLFSIHALSAVFRGKFLSGLQELFAAGRLQFHGQIEFLKEPDAFKELMRQAAAQKWVVYAKRPFAGPRQVLRYLSRYTHRVAISPYRLLALDEQKQTVSFTWKDYADGGKRKVMPLATGEFLRRFCLHFLPERLVKIRHFGFLSNHQRKARVKQARALLDVAQTGSKEPSKNAAEQKPETSPGPVCPHCGSRRLVLIEIVPAASARPLDSS